LQYNRKKFQEVRSCANDLESLLILSRVFSEFLNIVATSAPTERIFSVAGYSITTQRSNIATENLDRMIFLSENLDISKMLESRFSREFKKIYILIQCFECLDNLKYGHFPSKTGFLVSENEKRRGVDLVMPIIFYVGFRVCK